MNRKPSVLYNLPKEILEIIGEHLTIQDYHRLRFSCRLPLPKLPYLTFESYRNSQITYKNASDCLMKLHMSFLDLDRFLYLATENHVVEFGRSLNAEESNGLAPQFKQEAFRMAIMPIFKPFIILELVKDGEVDPSCYNNAALRYACKTGCEELVQLLLNDSRVDPTQSDHSSLRLAIFNGHTAVTKLLLQHPQVSASASQNEPICIASGLGHTEIFEILIKDPQVDINARDYQPLRNACHRGFVDIVKLMVLDPRVDPSIHDNIALRLACRYGHVDIVKVLLNDIRVDLAANDNHALLVAVEYNQLQVVKLLTQDNRIDPLHNGCECIQLAASMGQLDLLTFLLQLETVQSFIQKNGIPVEWMPSLVEGTENQEQVVMCNELLVKLRNKDPNLPILI